MQLREFIAGKHSRKSAEFIVKIKHIMHIKSFAGRISLSRSEARGSIYYSIKYRM